MIKAKKHLLQGNGSFDIIETWVNINEISTITKHDYYPHVGTYFFKMNNGDSFYAFMNEDELKEVIK